MDVCYCANYYSYIKCTYTVGMFGDRCRHCVKKNKGSMLSPGMLSDDLLWVTALPSYPQRDEPPVERPESISSSAHSSSPSNSSTSSWRSALESGRLSLAPRSTKTSSSTRETGLWRSERKNPKSW